jgi:hypothetical protein
MRVFSQPDCCLTKQQDFLKGIRMKFYLLSILMFLFSCSKSNETATTTTQPATTTKEQAVTVKDQGVPVKDQEVAIKDQEVVVKEEPVDIDRRLKAPEGVDCDKFFTAEGIAEADKTQKIYIADKEYRLYEANAQYVITLRLGYLPDQKILAILSSTIGEGKVCYDADSPIMIGLTLDETLKNKRGFVLAGSHKRNCGTAKTQNKASDSAVAIYPINVRSNFFQDALFYRPLGVYAVTNVKTEKGIMAEHLFPRYSQELMNGFRCAYKAFGYEYVLFKDLEDIRYHD